MEPNTNKTNNMSSKSKGKASTTDPKTKTKTKTKPTPKSKQNKPKRSPDEVKKDLQKVEALLKHMKNTARQQQHEEEQQQQQQTNNEIEKENDNNNNNNNNNNKDDGDSEEDAESLSSEDSDDHELIKAKKRKAKAAKLKKQTKLTQPESTNRSNKNNSNKNKNKGAVKKNSLAYYDSSGKCWEVEEMGDEIVKQVIEDIAVRCTQSVLNTDGLCYNVPSRSAANQIYIPELDRIVLKSSITQRPLSSVQTMRKTAITARVLELVHEVVSRGIHITKRDLFYTDVKLFTKQADSDAVLDDVACMVGCTRTSLNVVASEKGIVVGCVSFRDDGDFIDCTKMGVGGKAIPSLIDRITDIQGTAKFVLLVEKDAAFMRLSEDRFYQQYPCIIITAKGQPDVATRLFLKRVKEKLNIPILGLFDSDPYGLKILSVYMSGSKNMSYDSANLTTSDIKWLGVRPSDLNRYNIPKQCRLEMTETDIRTGKELLEEDFIKKNQDWVKELKIMLQRKEKAEIQALSNFGFQYLTQEYLPRKLRDGDWI